MNGVVVVIHVIKMQTVKIHQDRLFVNVDQAILEMGIGVKVRMLVPINRSNFPREPIPVPSTRIVINGANVLSNMVLIKVIANAVAGMLEMEKIIVAHQRSKFNRLNNSLMETAAAIDVTEMLIVFLALLMMIPIKKSVFVNQGIVEMDNNVRLYCDQMMVKQGLRGLLFL